MADVRALNILLVLENRDGRREGHVIVRAVQYENTPDTCRFTVT